MSQPQESLIAARGNQANSISPAILFGEGLPQNTTERGIRVRLQCSDQRCECHKPNGKTHCPCHVDKHPSLSITTHDEKVLVKCFSGCDQSTLAAAILGNSHGNRNRNRNGHKPTTSTKTAPQKPPKGKGKHFDWNEVEEIYTYHDAIGKVVSEIGRIGRCEKKKMSQRRPDGKGGYIYNLGDRGGADKPLYHLPEVLKAEIILLCEGEKASDFINQQIEENLIEIRINGIDPLKIFATTNPHGAERFTEQQAETLRDKDVWILPDNDEKGEKHAAKVQQMLYGIAKSVRVVRLPDPPKEKAGADDWIISGKGNISKLLEIAFDTIPNVPRAALKIIKKPPYSQIDKSPISFTIYPYFPRRHVTLLSGHGDSGKSYLSLVIAVHLAAGISWIVGDGIVRAVKVLFVSLEDESDIVMWRMVNICQCYGLEISTVWENLDISHTPDAFEPLMRESEKKKGLEKTVAWQDLKQQMPGYETVIIDNASDAYIANINDSTLVREFIRELQILAQHNNCAVVLLAHIDKMGSRYGTGGDSYTGTTAWHNTVRSRLALVKGKDTLELVHEKANLSEKAKSVFITRDVLGVPIVADSQTIADAKIEEIKTEAIEYAPKVLEAIKEVIKRGGDHITTNRGSGVTTFTFLKKNQLSIPPGGQKVFWAALDHLLDTGEIKKAEYKNSGRVVKTEIIIPKNTNSKVAEKEGEIA